jgi:hypothetical protein
MCPPPPRQAAGSRQHEGDSTQHRRHYAMRQRRATRSAAGRCGRTCEAHLPQPPQDCAPCERCVLQVARSYLRHRPHRHQAVSGAGGWDTRHPGEQGDVGLCVCVCVCARALLGTGTHACTVTHAHRRQGQMQVADLLQCKVYPAHIPPAWLLHAELRATRGKAGGRGQQHTWDVHTGAARCATAHAGLHPWWARSRRAGAPVAGAPLPSGGLCRAPRHASRGRRRRWRRGARGRAAARWR